MKILHQGFDLWTRHLLNTEHCSKKRKQKKGRHRSANHTQFTAFFSFVVKQRRGSDSRLWLPFFQALLLLKSLCNCKKL
ncbi:hypothetical protein SLA2020_320180 [Shorea laevis]